MILILLNFPTNVGLKLLYYGALCTSLTLMVHENVTSFQSSIESQKGRKKEREGGTPFNSLSKFRQAASK